MTSEIREIPPMITAGSKTMWRVGGKSVTGYSHRLNGLPNQDAIKWQPGESLGSPVAILAVSDGHGSARHFRSDIGSQLAVSTALSLLTDFSCAIDVALDAGDPDKFAVVSDVDPTLYQDLRRRIVAGWRTGVEKHYEENPFTAQERSRSFDHKLPLPEGDPALAYGATLLAIVATDKFILYLQLGDGDILAVDRDGRTVRPLAADERLAGDETTSLCMPDAWKELRIRHVPVTADAVVPVLILATTDGYANSFPESDDDFLQIGPDYLQLIRSRGLAALTEELESFLSSTSERGSGDDITLGVLKRSEPEDRDTIDGRLDLIDNRLNALEAVVGRGDEQEMGQDSSSEFQQSSPAKVEPSIPDCNCVRHGMLTVSTYSRSIIFAGILLNLIAVIALYMFIWKGDINGRTAQTGANSVRREIRLALPR